MTPHQFHIHLTNENCEFQNLTEDFKHAVYKNPKNGKKFTIPKDVETLLPEIIAVCCSWLEVDYPIGYSDKILEVIMKTKPLDEEE